MGKLYREDFAREFTTNTVNHYAVDLAHKTIQHGVVYDIEVIKQSITNIILTMMGERLFNLQFGTNLYGMIFNSGVTVQNAQAIKSHVIDKVLTYETRIAIYEEQSEVIFDPNLNELQLKLHFIVKETAERALWQETVVL